ncbi:ROK family transcriptional regulator [Pelagibacterium limicola]|uniref:ROK family transcriptional regulator n=1 Tax=Pelagibacterium limicola TaxID=2791022 RepID=UPI0018AFB30E|nr:ROK family protein [Pelagibacterium limicola]
MTSNRRQVAQSKRLAIGSNPGRNRAHNRRVVLEAIRLHGHLGRTEIARHAQLTAQAVANIVDELLDEGMLIETGRLRAGRGQPPIQFAINPDGPMTAGVEIAADHMVGVLLDLSGRVRAQAHIPLQNTSPAVIPGRVAHEVAALAELAGGGRILGIGVVMPGPFEVEAMSSVGPGMLPGWQGVDPVPMIGLATGYPVSLDNDATAAAVGERLYGAGRRIDNFCYLYFGAGLGLGIIQDGRPLRGTFGNAGEIGHVAITPRNRTALYGPDGAIENFVSVVALRARMATAGHRIDTVEAIEALYQAREPALLDWIVEAADHLAPAIAMLENIFDPETVIFGGGLPDCILEAMISALDPLPVSIAVRPGRTHPRVLIGQTGQLTAALGAAALPLLDAVSPHLSTAPAPMHLPSLA